MNLIKALVIILALGVLGIPSEIVFGQNSIINIPPVYSNKPINIDGFADDWKDVTQDKQHISFKGVPLPSSIGVQNNNSNALYGQIFLRNNDTHVSFFIKLNTTQPIHDTHRLVSILFDENGDGISTAGDDYIAIGTRGSLHTVTPYLIDAYVNGEHKVQLDPPRDTKTFIGTIRYISDSETTVELTVPFNGTNDFYDFKMLVPHLFTFILGYTAGQPNSNGGISNFQAFATGFSYNMAQKPAAILSGIDAICIFLVSIAISMCLLSVILRKRSKVDTGELGEVTPKNNKISIIALSVLVLSLMIVFLNPQVILDIVNNVNLMSGSIGSQNFAEVALYASFLGIILALITMGFLKRSKHLLSGIVYHQQLILKAPVILFVFLMIPIAATPILYLTLGMPAIIKNSVLVESIRSHSSALQDFMEAGINGIVTLPLFECLSIWIPSAFLIYMLYEIRSTKLLRSRSKIALISVSSALFIIIAAWNAVGLFVPAPDKLNYSSLLFGPTIATAILSFLAARGYISTIRGNLNKLGVKLPSASVIEHADTRDSSLTFSRSNRFWKIGKMSVAIILLVLSFIGIFRNLFLLTIPFVNAEFPLGYSLINETFLGIISGYAVAFNSGQSLEAAKVVYNSFVVFFSLFWIYDIIMTLRGFGEDFLNSENLVYLKLRKYVGPLTAMAFLSIIILFTIGQSLIDFRANQINTTLPEWVRKQIGVQSTEFQFLSNLASQLGFLAGLATLSGLIYVGIRSNLFRNRWMRIAPKIHRK